MLSQFLIKTKLKKIAKTKREKEDRQRSHTRQKINLQKNIDVLLISKRLFHFFYRKELSLSLLYLSLYRDLSEALICVSFHVVFLSSFLSPLNLITFEVDVGMAKTLALLSKYIDSMTLARVSGTILICSQHSSIRPKDCPCNQSR